MKRSNTAKLAYAAPLALLAVWACYNAPVETPAPRIVQETDVRVEQSVKNKVDLLFLVDDSPSMTPGQLQLKAQFPLLIKLLDDFAAKGSPASYHIGVVSSDLGSGPFTLGGGQCKPGGKGAKLITKGDAADVSCAPVTGGVSYINYNQLDGTNNLPPGQDLPTTFACMASVGDKGCGFEHQLEAVYRALKDTSTGFLRPDALLAVVFVTNEDDCSAEPNTDLFDPTKTQYGADISYRCSNYGIVCGNPPALLPYGDSGGTLSNCRPATAAEGGKLIGIDKYVNFFARPASQGGVKVNPQDVILTSIMAPAAPVSVILASPTVDPQTGKYIPCPGPVGTNCAVVLDHSCTSPTAFYGDPAVRISTVLNAVKNQQLTSVCDQNYKSAIEGLAQLIVSNIGAGCITSPLPDPASPDCIVEDVTSQNDGSTTITELPRCDLAGGKTPCWKLELKDVAKCPAVCAKPGDPGQHFGVTIDRGPGGQPPPNTTARVACSTIAVSKDPQTGMLPTCGPPL